MAAIFCENCSFSHFQHGHIFPSPEARGTLLLVMLGKVLLNLYVLRVRKQTVRESFMSYFCISLALFDLVLLVAIASLSYFQNFMLLDIRFTEYHICLLGQITAQTYGILHYPVSFVAGLDYYITITQTSKLHSRYWTLLYTVAVVLTWILVLYYVLNLPGIDVIKYISMYQCPFYISSQSYWLSVGMLFIVCLVIVLCWSEILNIEQSIKEKTKQSCGSVSRPKDARQLLIRLLICFMGTWAPFAFLQTLIVLLDVQIPAYIEMNVPWLYFINSFIIAVVCWVKLEHTEMKEETWDVDPFVNWEFCFVSSKCQDANETQKPINEIVIY